MDPKRTKAAHDIDGVQKAPSCKVLSAGDKSGGKGPSNEGLVRVPEADLCCVGLWEPFAGPLKEASRHVLKARRVVARGEPGGGEPPITEAEDRSQDAREMQ